MIILGIDPGTATTGYGLIRFSKKTGKLSLIEYGCIYTTPNFSDAQRLNQTYKKLKQIVKKNKPDILAIESVFFFKNSKTAIKVSQTKGVILFWAAKNKIPVYEFSPLQVKLNIVGYGRAQKKQIQRMIQEMFQLKEIPKPDDAADAIAIAVCCSTIIKNQKCEKSA
ncbi:crossover junction endodeoxyribonuclease RuvC [bacterium]|nr:crossover junction endodeoxyribonuclease RuvC [bacterium]